MFSSSPAPHRFFSRRWLATAIVLLPMAAALSGCSGFATGGIATASGTAERVDIEARSGTATIGTDGARASGGRHATTLCVDPATGAARAC